MSRRTDRVGDLIRAELSELILRRVRDPRVRLATISEVRVTADLQHARVLVSVLGTDEDQRLETVEALRHARGFLRSELARRLKHLRVTPELQFELDRGAEHSQRITELLEDLHDEDRQDEGGGNREPGA
jgi:ribosome-binding factor A